MSENTNQVEHKEELDSQVIEHLKMSKNMVGEIYPIIKDQHGNIISGRHRSQAGWTKTETIEVKNELQGEILAIHYNVQRNVPKEETIRRLTKLARILLKNGYKKSEITKEIARMTPYSLRYVQLLLPQEFKDTTRDKWAYHSTTQTEVKIEGDGITTPTQPIEEKPPTTADEQTTSDNNRQVINVLRDRIAKMDNILKQENDKKIELRKLTDSMGEELKFYRDNMNNIYEFTNQCPKCRQFLKTTFKVEKGEIKKPIIELLK